MKREKKLLRAFILFASVLILGACHEFDDDYFDNIAPSPPSGIVTVTGDTRVDLLWDHNHERDLSGYNVYYNYTYEGKYTLLGSTEDNYFVDYGAENGVTYYYAVAAYDYNGNESELSYDVVYDTPRPEGFNQSVFDYVKFPNNAGYSFGEYMVTSFDSEMADFFFENFDGTFYLNVWDDTDIQDMGETYDIYDVSVAPLSGWIPLNPDENVKYTEALEGHTYVIWTWNNHFAKVRISYLTSERMVFDWAYQTAEGNPELKIKSKSSERNKYSKVIKKLNLEKTN